MTEKKSFCEECNLEMLYCNWGRHLKSQTHIKNDPEQTVKLFESGRHRLYNRLKRLREKCNVEVVSNGWYMHVKTQLHEKNDQQ